jgi:hypothetical protein
MVNNSINIVKTKERLNSDGQQFHQYHQNKGVIFVDIGGGIVDHHSMS